MNRIKQIVKAVIILGVIAIALNFVFGNNTIPYIQKQPIADSTWMVWYKYDLNGYLRNLETTITDTTELKLQMPTRVWMYTVAGILEQEFWDVFVNDLAVILDYIIMILNVLIYPLKVGGYVLGIVLSFLGVNLYYEESDIHWLCEIALSFKALSIPYV